MNLATIEARLAAELGTPVPRSVPALAPRRPVPCRALGVAPGRVSPTSLTRHLAALPIPARTLALLTGNGAGFSPVEEMVVKWAHARTFSLVAKLRTGEVRVPYYRSDVAALVGLGPGLTPTGDDLLVGLAAMAQRLSVAGLVDPRAALAYATCLSSIPAAETTPTSRDLLANAAKGLFPSVLAAVVEMFGSPQADKVSLRERAVLLSQTGAHSGADLLAGALSLVRGVLELTEIG